MVRRHTTNDRCEAAVDDAGADDVRRGPATRPVRNNHRKGVVALMPEDLGAGIITIHVADHPGIEVDGDTATGSWAFEDSTTRRRARGPCEESTATPRRARGPCEESTATPRRARGPFEEAVMSPELNVEIRGGCCVDTYDGDAIRKAPSRSVLSRRAPPTSTSARLSFARVQGAVRSRTRRRPPSCSASPAWPSSPSSSTKDERNIKALTWRVGRIVRTGAARTAGGNAERLGDGRGAKRNVAAEEPWVC